MNHKYLRILLPCLALTLALGFILGKPLQQSRPAQAADWNGSFVDGWRQYQILTGTQKYEAASALLEKMLAAARQTKDGDEWTRCLIRSTQLRMALHGYETAVRFLKEQPWPEDWAHASIVNLFYARSLTTYAQMYSWEINQREKTQSASAVDLKAWTRDQIYEEAQKAYEQVWRVRDRLGAIPVAEWKEYLIPNNYPPGIRPTLRDAISYLRVEMLADTGGWRPEQLNDIFRLNLKSLIAGAGSVLPLTDPARHPLEKISQILADLESWHTSKNEPEAALEARLELSRRLSAHFSEAEDRKTLEADLEQKLKPLADYPWWAEGMAQLAELARSGEDPDFVRAREIALRGKNAFPQSIGGKHCRSIVESIEAPQYSVSGMQNDNLHRKSILVSHRNLQKIYFRAFVIDPVRTIESSKDYNLLPSGRELQRILDSETRVAQWEVPLPKTPDYRIHNTFIIPPIEKTGTYLIVASARPGFSKSDNILQGLWITLGDMVLVSRQNADDMEVTLLSGATGNPIPGAEVMLYRLDWQRGHRNISTLTTDKQGLVRFQTEPPYGQYFVMARNRGEVAFDPQHIYFHQRYQPDVISATLLYTDRSIYRPFHKVNWKAVAYAGRPGEHRFETSPNAPLTISLMDTNNQTVESKTVTTNAYGTASGEFTIPSGRALGQWRIESSRQGSAYIRVEEYKRPTFEPKILDPKEPLRLNRQARIKGEAKYYFGLPVSSGQIRWTAKRTPVYPWYHIWSGGPVSRVEQVIAAGSAALKEDGTFTFEFLPEIDERLGRNKDITYRYQVSADITDEGGETRSATRSFQLGFVSVKASAEMEDAFFLQEQSVKIKVLRTNLDGMPKPGNGTWRIVTLKSPSETLLPANQPLFAPELPTAKDAYRTPGDLERRRWNHGYNPDAVLHQWQDGAALASGSIAHNEKGEGTVSSARLAPGAYRLIYETVDDFGEQCELRKEFIVAAPTSPLPLPAILLLQNGLVKTGGTAHVLVHSGLKNQLMIFEIYRDGQCIRRQEIRSGKNSSLIDIPVTEQDRGGLGLSLSLVRDHQFITLQKSLLVPWDNKELKVEFSTFRDRLQPGRQETWSVKVTGPAGKDTAVPAAELLAYMYDRSLDSFAQHSPVSPLSLYPNRASAIYPRVNLHEAAVQWIESRGFNPVAGAPSLTPDQLITLSGYGIGGPGRRGRGAGMLNLTRDAVSANEMRMESSEIAPPPAPAPVMRAAVAVAPQKAKEEDAAGPAPAPAELRSEFSETAFWYPHLLTNADGSVTFEFKVPDSVTSWNVWVHAITRDFKSGSILKEAQSIKELMVRPYVPRFLREGDEAQIKVVVNNASGRDLKGSLDFDIIDAAGGQSVLQQFKLTAAEAAGKTFTVPAGGGTNLTFPIKTPAGVGQIAFKVTAKSGDFSDGELRPIPVLPGRMHLMQSRFITMREPGRRVMRFEDLARNDDPTRINEQMVVTLDAQLFYSVLSALPYLVNYPYECTEQTLNRFLSTGILSSLYGQYPAIERMAKEFSSRQTRFEQWDAADPNRKMALEETPWLQMAKGGKEDTSDLINVLDSRIARAQRESALALLRKSQTSLGGFPWFPGGPPSPYMTLYLLHGFSKALEFGVDVPREMVRPAWDYMHRHYLDSIVKDMVAHDSGWEFVTFINYVLSNYPEASWYENSFTPAERKTMLDFSFKHWKEHSPYLKGYLSLTLKRMGRPKDAMLVWESVMDSSKTAEDQGTFWAPEDRGWLWYNDTIESHAFAIRTEMELLPEDPKLDGMVLWILLNKKLNHWKSTRATSEVIYSLAHYMKKTGQLGIREDAAVTVGNQRTNFVFEPDQYTGKKNQVVIPGEKIDPKTASSVTVEKSSKGFLMASATWHFSTERLPEEERGDYLRLTRSYFKRVHTGREITLQPLREGAIVAAGDEVEVHLSLTSKHPMEYVHLRDPRGAGFEPSSNLSKHRWDLGIAWYEEIRDSGTNFFFEHLPQGEYTFKYRIRAATGGTFKVAPATVQPMYAPEFAAYSSGAVLRIEANRE